MKEREICKIYVDTFFQSKGIAKELVEYAINEYSANNLWALEKNERQFLFI